MSEATNMNELLLQSVESLPPLPETVRELQKYIDTAGSNMRIDRVAEIISGDPLITAKLLRLANSPFYGFSREIATIQQVINLLGVGNIRNIVIAESVHSNFKVDVSPYGLDTDTFLQNCNDESHFISDWLLEEDRKLSYLLVPCALLFRFGMIIFSNFLIQKGKDKEFLAALKKSDFNINMIEESFLGVDHLSFLAYLFFCWNFDEVLIESISFAPTPHSADGPVKKNAYALAIVNNIFSPYDKGSEFRVNTAISLLKEAKAQGINFDMDNFLSKLPPFARKHIK